MASKENKAQRGPGIRRRFARAQARAYSRFVARSSPERLEKLMRGRLRAPLLRAIFRRIPLMLKGEGRPAKSEVVEFRIARAAADSDVWQLCLAEGRCTVRRGEEATPGASIEFEPVAFLQMTAGVRSAPELFMAGKLRVQGNLMLAAALPGRFVFPRPGRPG